MTESVANQKSLYGKVALITGAGQGIGEAIASRFAEAGAVIGVADLVMGNAEAVAEDLVRNGHRAQAFQVDVSDSGQVSQMMRATHNMFGRIDILVNNAGIGHAKPFLQITLAEWEKVLSVNLTGTFLCAQAAARIMVEQGSGAIINVCSISGERGGTGRAAYGAAKAGVILLTKVMAVELASLGIRVNGISPGPTETEQVRRCHDAATREAYHRLLPVKRYARPSEIAAAALFLASPDSSFVSGHIMNVDGGFGAAGLILPAV
jgi:NAD(P)-dependent dehydrogenase (short-subunit alcohol dehydrogenase family)